MSDPWGISTIPTGTPQNLAVESTSRAGEPQQRKALDSKRAIAKMPSPNQGELHSLLWSQGPWHSSPWARQLWALPCTGRVDTLLSRCEPFLPTPCERWDKLQAQINKHYTVLGSQQQGNKLRAPAHMAEKSLLTGTNTGRSCPWQHAHTVSSVTPGVSYTPGLSPWELWRLGIILRAPPWDEELC